MSAVLRREPANALHGLAEVFTRPIARTEIYGSELLASVMPDEHFAERRIRLTDGDAIDGAFTRIALDDALFVNDAIAQIADGARDVPTDAGPNKPVE